MKLLTVAGELSGDAHGGLLLEEMRARLPGLAVRGIGGPRMAAAGMKADYTLADMQVHGLLEILRHLPRLYRILWHLERIMDADRPDAVLLIDYPGFNLKVAAAARKRGIPVYYYSSPQIWAWRGGRLKTIVANVDLMVVLFPFEQEIYRKAGQEVVFLGHPLAGGTPDPAAGQALRGELGLDADTPLLALMPGSRPGELRRILPGILAAVHHARDALAGYQAVIPVAPSLDLEEVRAMVEQHRAQHGTGDIPVHLAPGGFGALLQTASLAVVASGTATLQTALANIPFLVVYKVATLTYALARRVAYQPWFSIVNILSGRQVVPEFIQENLTPEKLGGALAELARDPGKQAAMRDELAGLAASLGEGGAYQRAGEMLAGRLTEDSQRNK